MRDSCLIYRSFYEAINELPVENQAELWNAIFEFALNFKEPEITGLSRSIFTLIRPNIEANIKRYHSGNMPKHKQTRSKTEAKHKQEVSKPEANANVNANVNKDVNVDVDVNEIKPTSCDSQKSEPLPQFEKSDSTKTDDPPETVGAAAPPKTGKKEPFKQPETKPKPEPLHVPCKKIFMDFFKDRNGVDYYWRGRDGKAINSIIKQLRGRGTGDTEIPDVFKIILNKIEDKWMLSNLDVSLLDSKFNQVITKIKNETKQLSYEEIKSEFKRRAEQHG